MTDNFLNLDPEKQERILNAAFQEFADHGYDKASTNRIVKEAGIGKGMLFYYFKSKQDLFNYLVEYGTEFVIREYLNKINDLETDFIELYKQTSRLKFKAYSKNPYVFNFFGSFYVNHGMDKIPEHFQKMVEDAKKIGYEKLFKNADKSCFRTDIPLEKIMNFIKWTLEGYEKDLVNGLNGKCLSTVNLDPYWAEFDEYLEALKKILYK